MSNACAPIPLQWKPGPIFAFRSVIRSVKLAKIGRGDEAIHRPELFCYNYANLPHNGILSGPLLPIPSTATTVTQYSIPLGSVTVVLVSLVVMLG